MNLIWIAILSVIALAVLTMLAYEGFDRFPGFIEIPLIVLIVAVFIFTGCAVIGAYGEIVWMLGLAERVI